MDDSSRVGTSQSPLELTLISGSFSEELAGLHKTMDKLLQQKDDLQRGLGNEYGV